MLYAKVVLALAVRGPFDYIVSPEICAKARPGVRVWVDFCGRKQLGYVVGLSDATGISKLKTISELIDDVPVLDKNLLLLTRRLADYYCCSWGEMIETALPAALRKGRKIEESAESPKKAHKGIKDQPLLIHDLDGKARWEIYLAQIKEALEKDRSALVLLPDIASALKAKEVIDAKLKLDSCLLYRKQPAALEAWLNVRLSTVKVVSGTRSAVFAPLKDLGLIILDAEEDSVYKQDQVPHYHARQAAFLRADLEKAKLILGSTAPSLESYYLAQKKKIKYIFIPKKAAYPQIKIVDMRHLAFAERKRKPILSRFLEDAIYSELSAGAKVLLFLNRRGFATFSFCHNCGAALKCPRCDLNLVYHFELGSLNCHHCNFKMPLPEICPKCNAGYIKFAGLGTEKIESELSRIFASAKIVRFENNKPAACKDADICIATSAVIRNFEHKFGLIGVLLIDNSLQRTDLRGSEKTFALLSGLLRLTDKRMIIQTRLPKQHCFRAIGAQEANLFYEEELRQRKQSGFPPYKHLVTVKLRGESQARVEEAARALFKKLSSAEKDKGAKAISVSPAQPAKLRGNFYWQVLLSFGDVKKANDFLKISLKDFRHSGIIVTVDVDPL